MEGSAVVLAGVARERDCDPGPAGTVWLGAARLFHSVGFERNPVERNSLERNASAWGQPQTFDPPAASGCTAGGLVCLPLREDGLSAGQPRILSLQRCRYVQSSAHPACARNEALAAFRILRPLPAHAGGIARHASSAAKRNRCCPSANSVLGTGGVSFCIARLPGFHVNRRRRGAGSLPVAGRPARDSDAGRDSVAARAVLETDCGSDRDCICRGTFQQSAVRILSRRQSGLSRLHRDACRGQPLPGDAIFRRARSNGMASVGRTHPAMARLYECQCQSAFPRAARRGLLRLPDQTWLPGRATDSTWLWSSPRNTSRRMRYWKIGMRGSASRKSSSATIATCCPKKLRNVWAERSPITKN